MILHVATDCPILTSDWLVCSQINIDISSILILLARCQDVECLSTLSVLCLVSALSDCIIIVSSYSGGELLLTRFHMSFSFLLLLLAQYASFRYLISLLFFLSLSVSVSLCVYLSVTFYLSLFPLSLCVSFSVSPWISAISLSPLFVCVFLCFSMDICYLSFSLAHFLTNSLCLAVCSYPCQSKFPNIHCFHW